ncbi:MAG: translation elongation factor Ts [Fimbriimonadaceae bacterium]
MEINAAMVKKLREETGAPMMECKRALVESEGDAEKAKKLLREKGQAAAAKRAGRETAEGIARFVLSENGKVASGIVLECETDFVARNEDFQALAKSLAEAFLNTDPGASPLEAEVSNGETVGSLIEGAVAKIRENIKLGSAVRLVSDDMICVYNHHDGKKASAVTIAGDAENLEEVGNQVAVQVVAFPPSFLKREDVPQDVIDKEIEIETQRAINDGKKPEIAANIAKGRVNKEYYQAQVLLEQPFYLETKSSTSEWMKSNARGSAEIKSYTHLKVGSSE